MRQLEGIGGCCIWFPLILIVFVGIGGALLALVDFSCVGFLSPRFFLLVPLLVFRLFLAFVSSREDLCFCLMLGLRTKDEGESFSLVFDVTLLLFGLGCDTACGGGGGPGKARHTHAHTK
jgi:hypothetical protein